MRNLYALILFLLVLSLSACLEKHDSDTDPFKETKPYPKGARKINLIVDEAYDLINTKAHSIFDSVSMGGDENGLYVPKEFESAVFFIDENSGEILAVVLTDTVSNEAVVNAETVTAALHNLIPSYLSLPNVKRAAFDSTAITIPEYIELVSLVDKLLLNKNGIYSTDDKFIDQLLKVNTVIMEKYSHDGDHRGERKAKLSDEEVDMPNWLKKDKAPQIENAVYSHVDAVITPIHTDQGKPVTTVPIKPREIFYDDVREDITNLSLRDGYYNLKLTQKSKRAKDDNLSEIAGRLAGILMGQIFGLTKGQSVAECQVAMVGAVVSRLNSSAFTPPSDWKEGAKLVIQTGMDAIITFGTSDKCRSTFMNKAVFAKMVAKHANVWYATIDKAILFKDAAEIGPWVMGYYFGIELDEDMQVYNGKVIPGCVGFKKTEGSVPKESYTGEQVRPALETYIISSYDGIDLGQVKFKVTWDVTDGNGTVTSPANGTNHEGKTINTWTLPDNRSGKAILAAEIKDKEGDHLEGSPIEFNVQLNHCDSNFVLGTYLVEEYNRCYPNPDGSYRFYRSYPITISQEDVVEGCYFLHHYFCFHIIDPRNPNKLYFCDGCLVWKFIKQ